MRGQVITPQGLGIVGIRVSVDRDSRFGFTLTRQGGWWVEAIFFKTTKYLLLKSINEKANAVMV